jgi:hypothetical protein
MAADCNATATACAVPRESFESDLSVTAAAKSSSFTDNVVYTTRVSPIARRVGAAAILVVSIVALVVMVAGEGSKAVLVPTPPRQVNSSQDVSPIGVQSESNRSLVGIIIAIVIAAPVGIFLLYLRLVLGAGTCWVLWERQEAMGRGFSAHSFLSFPQHPTSASPEYSKQRPTGAPISPAYCCIPYSTGHILRCDRLCKECAE